MLFATWIAFAAGALAIGGGFATVSCGICPATPPRGAVQNTCDGGNGFTRVR